ncbi:MAG: hypothetical protein HKN37_12965 [Rhodothermales bacterium]|jgi:hypothetical protein|nr:hypothetical protein [Rhodothermales bacterium]
MAGKGLLIMIAAFGISFAFYSSSRFRSMVEVQGQAADYQYQTLARDAAKTGFSRARQAMSMGIESTVMTADLTDGTYRSVLSSAGTRFRIESQGRLNDTRAMPVVWKIYAEYERLPKSTPTTVPPFMEYALLAKNDLELTGSPDVQLAAFGDAQNANIHTNNTLKITGNNVNVGGFGTFVEGATANPADALATSFSPVENELERESVHQVEEITIPLFDASAYIATAGVDQMSAGDITLSGAYDLGGTREDPFVWYIDGNLDATGGTTIDGYVMFLVNGDIDISGNMQAGMSTLDQGESTMAFYSSGSISFSGTVDIYGQFFANGNFEVKGTPSVYGTVTTGGSASLTGTPNLSYVQASPALTDIWNDDDPERFRLLSYHEARDRIPEDKVDLYFVSQAD